MEEQATAAIDLMELRQLTAKVVAAYVGNNAVPVAELPGLVSSVHGTLRRLMEPKATQSEPETLAPAVPIRRSVHDNYIVCLECGQKLKMLKRHLKADHGMAPDDYRIKWKLPTDYPMVAPSYARARSDMAVEMGLGRKGPGRD